MTPLSAEDAYWHACANVPIIEPGPMVAFITPIILDCVSYGWMVTFSDGVRVHVFADEVSFRPPAGTALTAEARICRIAEQRRAAGNVLPERER